MAARLITHALTGAHFNDRKWQRQSSSLFIDARAVSCTKEHTNKSERKRRNSCIRQRRTNAALPSFQCMKKNRREARKNKRPFRLPIRLCKPNGKHIIRNKTQRHKDNSSVFVWRCLLLTLNWKSHKVMGGNRANSAIFVQVISYTYLRSLRPERAQTENK